MVGDPYDLAMPRIIAFYVFPIVLSIYCLVEAITSRDDEVRHLGKGFWILLILFFPFVGSLAWLFAGRPLSARRVASAHERETPHFPEYDRPGRMAATAPDQDDDFLRQVRERAEQQRRDYEAKRRADRAAEEREREERRARREAKERGETAASDDTEA